MDKSEIKGDTPDMQETTSIYFNSIVREDVPPLSVDIQKVDA